MDSIYHQVLKELRLGSRLVLATVIRTARSTPQKPGSAALFGESGLLSGTVGGGQLEGEIDHIARSVLISGVSDHYYFNLNNKQDEEGPICGGEALVLVDANPVTHIKSLEAMEKSLLNRCSGYLLTEVGGRRENGRSVKRHWIVPEDQSTFPPDLDATTKDTLVTLLNKPSGPSFLALDPEEPIMETDEMIYLEYMKPLPRLIIAGGGHVGKALAHLGALLDFEVTVYDDRPEFANKAHIPDATKCFVEDIGAAMRALSAGDDTYIVIVTRGHQHDAEALIPCIGSKAAYVGMIGSKNKVKLMERHFLSEGLATPEQWSGIHAPIGLPIGSKSVQEIAVSIAAELVSIRSQHNQKNDG